jgi:hypothetical protein
MRHAQEREKRDGMAVGRGRVRYHLPMAR